MWYDVVWQENRTKAAKDKHYWEWRSGDGALKCLYRPTLMSTDHTAGSTTRAGRRR